MSLPLPEQEIIDEGGRWRLEFRTMLPVETWNAQISLLTGMAAASLMVYGRVGVLRTLPPPDGQDVQRLHRTAKALRIDWPAEQLYPDFIRSLDPSLPHHAAMVLACTQLLRGSGYVGFNGAVPGQPEHSALASEYAHVTAPLTGYVRSRVVRVSLSGPRSASAVLRCSVCSRRALMPMRSVMSWDLCRAFRLRCAPADRNGRGGG